MARILPLPFAPDLPQRRSRPAPPRADLFGPQGSYGNPVPFVIGTDRVRGQRVYHGTPTGIVAGQRWNGSAWVDAAGDVADVVVAICEAPVQGLLRLWTPDKQPPDGHLPADWPKLLATATGGYTAILDAASATAWQYYAGTAAEGMGHAGTAHLRFHHIMTGPAGTFWDQVDFEVKGYNAGAGGESTLDAHPADALLYLFTDAKNGLGLSSSLVNVDTGIGGTAADSYRRYCSARGWYVSRAVVERTSVLDLIAGLLLCTDSTLVLIDGKLTVVPMGDQTITRASFTFTPTLTATVIDGSELIHDEGEPPVHWERVQDRDIFAVWPVTFRNRAKSYETESREYIDPVWSALGKPMRRAPVTDLDWVLDPTHAFWVAYSLAQRATQQRNRAVFRLAPRWSLLTPMDFISFTDVAGVPASETLRILSTEEQDDGSIEFEAIEWPSAITEPIDLTQQAADGLLTPNLRTYPVATADLTNITAVIGGGNQQPNSSFEVDTDADGWADCWGNYNAGFGSPTRVAGLFGSYAQRVTTLGGVASPRLMGKSRLPWFPSGTKLRVSAHIRAPVGQTAFLGCKGFGTDVGGGGEVWQGTTVSVAATGGWQRVDLAVTAGADGYASALPGIGGTPSAGVVVDFDGVQVEVGTVLTGYAPASSDGEVAAAAALARITEIASDDLLTPGEKPTIILDDAVVVAEQAGIDAQATSYGVTAEKTAYDNAVSALATYLATLTTPVLWSNLTGNTTVVGTTFRSKFSDVYAARTALLNAIAARAKLIGDAGVGSSLVPNPNFDLDVASTWPTMVQVARASAPTGCPTAYCGRSQSRDNVPINRFPVVAGQKFVVEAWIDTTQSAQQAQFGLTFFDSTGAAFAWTGCGLVNAGTAWTRKTGTVWVPAGSVTAQAWAQISAYSNFGSVYFTGLRVSEASAAQAAADAANALLADIASDAKLTSAEKRAVWDSYKGLYDSQAGLDSQATTFGITTEKTAFDSAMTTLKSYAAGEMGLPSSNPTDGQVATWMATTTTITPATFRANFAAAYSTQTALTSAIAEKARTLQASPAGAVTTSILPQLSDRDNLWPNPSSELAPPAGADATLSEWADRLNAGAGAYSGSWVRQVSGSYDGFWVPCSPGAQFYAEAMAKKISGAGSGGALQVGFYSTFGDIGSGLGSTLGVYSASGSWTKVTVTSAAAPAGTNAAFISYGVSGADVIQFDALYARRIAQPEMIASDVGAAVTAGTGWTLNTDDSRLAGPFRVGVLLFTVTAGTGAAWSNIATFPAGQRPILSVGIRVLGRAKPAAGNWVVGVFLINTSGLLTMFQYDDGASLNGAPWAIAVGDQVAIDYTFPIR